MFVYEALGNLGYYLAWMRGLFYDIGINTRGVYLLGDYISSPFFFISDRFDDLSGAAYSAANEWLVFYNWILAEIQQSNPFPELIAYADDLINFITDPWEFINSTISQFLPGILDIASDPVEWVLETLYQYTGLDIDFVDNPYAVIQRIVNDAIQGLQSILNDPIGWLIDWLNLIIPDFDMLMTNAELWVVYRLYYAYPWMMPFLNDPDGYIEQRFLDFFEKLTDLYIDRVLRVAEKVLNTIF